MVNEETVVAFCLLSVFYGIFKYGGPMYNDWAQNQIQKIKDILNTARAGHADAVKARIEDVKPLSNVVEITKTLFEVSKVRYWVLLTFLVSNRCTGNRQARGRGFRAGAEDCFGCRSKVRTGLLGTI